MLDSLYKEGLIEQKILTNSYIIDLLENIDFFKESNELLCNLDLDKDNYQFFFEYVTKFKIENFKKYERILLKIIVLNFEKGNITEEMFPFIEEKLFEIENDNFTIPDIDFLKKILILIFKI